MLSGIVKKRRQKDEQTHDQACALKVSADRGPQEVRLLLTKCAEAPRPIFSATNARRMRVPNDY